jgi:hypothetical protein
MGRLTKRSIDSLRTPAAGQTFTWDSELRGFGVRITSGGIKTYVVQYRNEEGRTRRTPLGRCNVLTAEEARTAAKIKLGAVAAGEDPAQERKERRGAPTVGEICDWYLTEAETGRLLGRRNRPIKASTLYMDRSRIDRHIKPLIGARQVAKLCRPTSQQDEHRRLGDRDAVVNRKAAQARPRGQFLRFIQCLSMPNVCTSSKRIPPLVFVGLLATNACGV